MLTRLFCTAGSNFIYYSFLLKIVRFSHRAVVNANVGTSTAFLQVALFHWAKTDLSNDGVMKLPDAGTCLALVSMWLCGFLAPDCGSGEVASVGRCEFSLFSFF